MSNITNFLSHFDGKGGFSKTARFQANIYPPQSFDLYDSLSFLGLSFQCEAAELPGYNVNTVESRIYGAPYQVGATPVYNDLRLTFICTADLIEKRLFDSWLTLVLPSDSYTANYRNNYIGTIQINQYYDYGLLKPSGYTVGSKETEEGFTVFGKQFRKKIPDIGNVLKNVAADTAKSSILSALGIPAPNKQFGVENEYSVDNATGNASQLAYSVKFLEVFPYSTEPISLNWQDDGINRLTVAFKYKKWEYETFKAETFDATDKGRTLSDKLQQGLTTISSIKSLLR